MTRKLEGSDKNGPAAAAAKPPVQKDKSVRRLWGAAGVAAGSVVAAALMFHQCGKSGGPEGIRTAPPVAAVTCPAQPACVQTPQRPQAPTPNYQLCGNGVRDRNVPVVTYTQQADGTWVAGDVSRYTESCTPGEANYCEPDCPAPAARRGGGSGEGGGSPAGSGSATTVRPPVETSDVRSCTVDELNRLRRPARDSLAAAMPTLRTATSAQPTESVTANISVRVRNGVPAVTGVGLSAASGGSGRYSGSVDVSAVSFQENVNCNGSFSLTMSGG